MVSSTTTGPDVTVEPRAPIRVGIADDNAVVRLGIRSLLGTADDVVVVGEAGDGVAAVALAKAKKPDVMLLDVRMPRQDGVVSAREVAQYSSVLMLTYSESPEVIAAAVQAGALGYLVHGNFSEEELINSVRMAVRGFGTFSAAAVAALSKPVSTTASRAARYGLSEREAEVMAMVASGSANPTIARTLFISEKTVKNHINHIFAKLAVTSRGQAVAQWLADPVG